MVQEIADIYNKMPEEQRKKIGILTNNWGQSSAVHFYREKYELPEPISPHGWFYFYTKNTHQFKNSYISIGIELERLDKIFDQVEKVGFYSNPYCMPHENNKTIYLCKKPKYDLKEYWTNTRY